MCDITAMLLKGAAAAPAPTETRPEPYRTEPQRHDNSIYFLSWFNFSQTRMFFSSPLNFGSSLHLTLLVLLIIAVAKQVEGRPSPRRQDAQVLQDLFGLKISSLVLAHPEVSEGSADEAPPLSQTRHGNGAPSRVFLELLGRHRKLQGRSRKGVARGCFGMKVDRIGVISGLGC